MKLAVFPVRFSHKLRSPIPISTFFPSEELVNYKTKKIVLFAKTSFTVTQIKSCSNYAGPTYVFWASNMTHAAFLCFQWKNLFSVVPV